MVSLTLFRRAGLPLNVNGDGLLQDASKQGHYSVRYGFGVPFQGTYSTVIDTDYEEYAVVYSCTNSLLSGVFHTGINIKTFIHILP